MVEKLKIKAIYDDFLRNVHLTEEQVKIIDMLLNKETIIKMSIEMGMSQRTISYEIKKLKNLYNQYCQVQLFKAEMLSK